MESFCLPTTLLTSILGTAENWLGSRGLLDLIGVHSLWMFLSWLITGIITRVKNRQWCYLEIIIGWDYMRAKLILRKVRWGKTVKNDNWDLLPKNGKYQFNPLIKHTPKNAKWTTCHKFSHQFKVTDYIENSFFLLLLIFLCYRLFFVRVILKFLISLDKNLLHISHVHVLLFGVKFNCEIDIVQF